jgi:glycerophosphoryl diester phosphodiesterase
MAFDHPLPTIEFLSPVIAHRGASAVAPENTLAAFQRASDDGALWIETDIKLTHDGVPILFHDEDVARTTNGKGLVAEQDWGILQKLDAGSWFNSSFTAATIPTLADGIRFATEHDMRLNLEIKPCPGRTRATVMVALIELTKITSPDALPPLISSFDIEALTIAANLHPECPRGLLLDQWRDDWADVMRVTEAQTLNLNHSLLTTDRLAMFRDADVSVLAYVVNDPVRAKELLHQGVKAVFSNNPGMILKSL